MKFKDDHSWVPDGVEFLTEEVIEMSDNVKATLFFAGFLVMVPSMYLAPTILNALTDIAMRF